MPLKFNEPFKGFSFSKVRLAFLMANQNTEKVKKKWPLISKDATELLKRGKLIFMQRGDNPFLHRRGRITKITATFLSYKNNTNS